MAVNKKLGKGLSSLLGNKVIVQNKASDNKNLLLIPIEKIFRDVSQPRKEFDKEKIEELAQSIVFKKNKTIGIKIKNIGEKILKKTIKELDYLINNEFKKT